MYSGAKGGAWECKSFIGPQVKNDKKGMQK